MLKIGLASGQIQKEKQSEINFEQIKSLQKIEQNQEDNKKQETNPQILGEQEQPNEINLKETRRQGSYVRCLEQVQPDQIQKEEQRKINSEQLKSILKIKQNQDDNTKQETSPQIPDEQIIFLDEQTKQVMSIQNIYLQKPSLKRIILHHSFFSIFYIYKEVLTRPLRFQIIYLDIIHSLAISIVFSDYQEIAQKIVIAIIYVGVIESFLFFTEILFRQRRTFKVISTILKIIVFGIYFYIIMALVSGTSPSEANSFFQLFLISTGMNFVIVQFSLSFFKDFIIKKHQFTEQISFLVKYLFKLFKLEEFLKSL
ncbi:hypothetical protein ABPG72_001675 [Tetrahymena utriculariae]